MTKSIPILYSFKTKSEVSKESTDSYDVQNVLERIQSSSLFEGEKVESASKVDILKHDTFPHKMTLNGFAEAIHLAYDRHHGLALSPDHIFIVIVQGLSIHINQDAEKHRQVLGLGHLESGTKETIDVRRDHFQLGNFDNDWQGVFPEFKDKIGEKVDKEIHSLLASEFSTTTPLSSAVLSLTIMDAFKSFFEYSVTTMCGIPEIALMGTKDDWELLRCRAKELLSRFEGLEFWTPHLLPILDHFVDAASGKPDTEFWTNLYKPEGGSGGPYVRGWINAFFPYLQNPDGFKENRHIDWSQESGFFSGLTYDEIPSGFTKTPFIWNYYDQKLDMNFIGGFLGAEAFSDNFISPSLSWAVIHEKKE